jgi:hypothetical protein
MLSALLGCYNQEASLSIGDSVSGSQLMYHGYASRVFCLVVIIFSSSERWPSGCRARGRHTDEIVGCGTSVWSLYSSLQSRRTSAVWEAALPSTRPYGGSVCFFLKRFLQWLLHNQMASRQLGSVPV